MKLYYILIIFILVIITAVLVYIQIKPSYQQNITIPNNKETCEALGGRWGKIGLSQEEVCNLPTKDAGKSCSDLDECEGSCIAELSSQDLDKLNQEQVIYTKGNCTAWKITIGCHAFIEDGKVEYICID